MLTQKDILRKDMSSIMELLMNNGKVLPLIGFGTYRATENDGIETIKKALDAGYRYFDTASFYFNETQIGDAINEAVTLGKVEREELFIADKVWPTELGYDKTIEACEESLKKLRLDYLDLYLVHWPRSDMEEGWQTKLADTWKAMEYLYKSGKVKAIGVSNFLPHHLRVIESIQEIKPMVNQLELHIGYMQEYACSYCRNKGILIQAWSPIGRSSILADKEINTIAQKYNVSAAKLALRFLTQLDISVIPKSSSFERMKENLTINDFTISEDDMSYLRCLPQRGWSGEHPDFFNFK